MRQALLATPSFCLPFCFMLRQIRLHKPRSLCAARPATVAAAGAADRGSVAKPVRISTGVVAPSLFTLSRSAPKRTNPWINVAVEKTVTVNMIVDATGKPAN